MILRFADIADPDAWKQQKENFKFQIKKIYFMYIFFYVAPMK